MGWMMLLPSLPHYCYIIAAAAVAAACLLLYLVMDKEEGCVVLSRVSKES